MAKKEIVLDILRDHQDTYTSGQDLAQALQVSRQAIWEVIRDLRESGHEIEAVPRLGYRLAWEGTPLDEGKIRQALIPDLAQAPIRIFESVDSTNTRLAELDDEEDLPSYSLVLAEGQTQGKGRAGRTFASPPYRGIYMSILLKKEDGTSLELTTIKACLALALAIEETTDKTPLIKWVNDLYLEGKKIAGILTEGRVQGQDLVRAIVGLGLNYSTRQEDLDPSLRDKVGALFPQGASRERLIGQTLSNFYKINRTWPREEIISAYSQRNLVLGREVSFMKGNVSYQGRACDINQEGNLLVDLGGHIMTLNSGEVSLEGDWG